MKVVHIIFNIQLGGAETMLVDIISNQLKLGYDVSLIVINSGYNKSLLAKIDAKIKIVYIMRPESSKNPWYIFKLNYKLAKLSPDVVHVHNDKIMAMVLKRKRTKYVITIHDTRINLKYFKRVDEVCSISKAVKDDIYNRYGIHASLVYNGIEIEKVLVNNRKLDCNEFKILQIGRLVHQKKGQDILIRAVSLLSTRLSCKLKIDFIGEGPSLQYLQQMVASFNLTGCVNFRGAQNRQYIYEHIKDYDLLVQPSIYEGFGLTVVEGMAAKIPVLVTKNEGPLEIIDGGKYGEYFDINDVEGCASKLLSIMQSYSTYKHIADVDAYKFICENFDIANTVKGYDKLYKKT